jgi:glycosyltransferase involved in cell wall biosynthesis
VSRFESLSVFFPAYNDAPSLPKLIETTFGVLSEHVHDYEVIVVNDGSRDDTGEVLARLERRYTPRMRVVTHEQNRGYGGALRSGFAAASKDYVFYTDGDGQYDVRELPKLLEKAASDVGLVNGYKLERNDPRHRVLIGSAYNAFARFLFRVRIRDIDCDYRLIRRDLLDHIRLTSTSGTICVELVRKLELLPIRVVEVGVHHYPRVHGRSQFFRVRSLAKTLSQLFRLWVQVGWERGSARAARARQARARS